MKQYREYMDGVRVSDTLHRRLAELEAPARRPVPWVKYGSLAAALALVVGLGTWWLSREEAYDHLVDYDPAAPENEVVAVPDIALVDPGDITVDPGEKTLWGYEATTGSGSEAMVTHYILPYIEYGEPSGVSADLSLAPPDGGLRGAVRDDVLALIGNEDALAAHLNWGDFEFSGTVGFEADGTVWMMSLWGENEDTAFSLQLSPDRLPPTCCVVMGEPRTITNVWGVEVSGVKNMGAYGDTERGIYMDVCREVEFIANGVGCRLKAYGTQDGAVEELVSRFVRWAVLEGLDLSGISSDGAAPEAIDPNYSVGEPNWNDSGEGWTCPDCGMHIEAGAEHHHSADGGVDTSYYDPNGYALNAYDPNELADRGIDPGQAVPESDSSLTCRTCGGGVPDGTGHYCKPDGSGGYVCALCGQAFPEGKVHSHEMCELPVAPDTVTCPDCGMTYLAGEAHECGMCDGYPLPHVCEVCGEAYPEGTAHTCSQGGHHQEQHHGGHH